MMSLMNVMCGNMELECAYAAYEHWESVKDGRNIFEKLGKQHLLNPCGALVMLHNIWSISFNRILD